MAIYCVKNILLSTLDFLYSRLLLSTYTLDPRLLDTLIKMMYYYSIKHNHFNNNFNIESEVALGKKGRPRKENTKLRGKNDARSELTKKACFSAFVSTSLQPCSLKDNQITLERICQKQMEEIRLKIQGLLAVLHSLQAEHIAQDGKPYDTSFISFDEATEIYFAYQNKVPPFTKADHNNFTYALLHQTWGLCVHIIFVERLNKRFIVLRPDFCSLEVFLDMLCSSDNINVPFGCTKLDSETIQGIMQTVDTEWDRKVARVFLGASRSRNEIKELGIDPDNIKQDTAKVCPVCFIFVITICVMLDKYTTSTY